jgi:hypothetical protein
MQIEKFISQQIERQFPSIYREDGPELVAFVKAYYEWLESTENQSLYNSRRYLEYNDIDSTLEKMLLFFKNKYMADLPYDPTTVRFIIKNILDLYRKRGTNEGVKLFFQLFYNTEVTLSYPSGAILKPSASEWFVGKYIQLFPDNPENFKDIIGKPIYGSVSKAEGVVNNALFTVLNGAVTPIIYVDEVKGSFIGYDNVYIDGVKKGVVYGSMFELEVINDPINKSGYSIGDILTTDRIYGIGGKALVTSVTNKVTGEIEFRLEDGGYGYTLDGTDVILSDQLIFFSNTDIEFVLLETLRDQANNEGIVIGQDSVKVGVKMLGNTAFSNTSVIETVDRDDNFIVDFSQVTLKNSSGAAAIGSLEYTSNVSVITDVIENFANVALDSSDYNTIPPALAVMSGNTIPTTANTPLNEAFDLTPITIGRIATLAGINPGEYVNDVFTLALDPTINTLDIKDQILYFSTTAPSYLQVGRIISQNSKFAVIKRVLNNSIYITPFTVERFVAGEEIQYEDNTILVVNAEIDYNSRNYGLNADIVSEVSFATGKITGLRVIDSGYGYKHRAVIIFKDASNIDAVKARVNARGQGTTEGTWRSTTSHLNFASGQRLQDSFYYQAFSYEVNSKIDINTYEKFLKEATHLAGTKFFGNFLYDEELDVSSTISTVINL